jgi:hypothetical protein
MGISNLVLSASERASARALGSFLRPDGTKMCVRFFFTADGAVSSLSQKQITPFTFSEGICILACVPPDVDVEFLLFCFERTEARGSILLHKFKRMEFLW